MESTARAERFESQSAATPAYSWEVPQKPVIVRIPYPVIDKLENEAVETFRSLDAKGSEIGGILFGRASNAEPVLVSVEDYELIVCEYSRGPLYRLSDADLARFDRVIAQHSGGGATPVVGFFRSHTRRGLALDAEDLVLFETRFKDPRKVALLVRPFATKASSAGFFIWEGGQVHGESSYLEFPFRSSQLATFKPSEVAESGLSATGLGGGALPAPSIPRNAARAQIVPIASRRESSPAGVATPGSEPPTQDAVAAPEPPAPSPAPVVTAEAAPAAAPAETREPAAKSAVPAPAGSQPKASAPVPTASAKAAPASKNAQAKTAPAPAKTVPAKSEPATAKSAPAAAKTEAAPAKSEAAAAKSEAATTKTAPAPAKSEAAPVSLAAGRSAETLPDDAPAAEEEPARSNKFLWLAIGAIVPIILMVVLFVYPGVFRSGSKSAAPGADTSALSLRVERTGGELQLTWNRDSDPIRGATKGILSITDGSQHQDVELDLTQLQKGSIAYTPASTDVVFRMEITTKGQAKAASEMVRALSTRPSPLAGETPLPAGAVAPAANTAPAPAPDSTAASQVPPVEAEQSKTPARVLKPFRAENLSQRLHAAPAASSTDLPDAPSVGRVDQGLSVSALNVNAVPSPVAPPPPPKAAAPATAPPAPAPVAKPVTGGQIQQAVLVSRKEPEYPRLARETRVKGAVELTATIGVDGKVKKVDVVKGHPLLAKAASEAIMQWIYKPTVLNGKAVEGQTQILINFTGDR